MRLALIVFGSLLALYVAVCVVMYATQRRQLYFPTPETLSTRARAVTFDVGGAELKVWQVTPPEATDALIYFGGNAEDVGDNIARFDNRFDDHAVFLVNYRGYGGSTGSPSEAALLADAVAIFDDIAGEFARVVVVGRSLGSGVAVHLAAEREVDRLILVTPYDSVAAVAQRRFPFLPVAWLLKDRFDSASRAAAIDLPVLIIRAEHDRVIPPSHTETLIDRLAHTDPQVVTIPGSDHADLVGHPLYLESMAAFVTSDRGVTP